jgi:single-strand DNA-binding protein
MSRRRARTKPRKPRLQAVKEYEMNDLNSVLIEGKLAGDPLVREAPDENPVCTFTIASNRFYEGDGGQRLEEASFFDVKS